MKVDPRPADMHRNWIGALRPCMWQTVVCPVRSTNNLIEWEIDVELVWRTAPFNTYKNKLLRILVIQYIFSSGGASVVPV